MADPPMVDGSGHGDRSPRFDPPNSSPGSSVVGQRLHGVFGFSSSQDSASTTAFEFGECKQGKRILEEGSVDNANTLVKKIKGTSTKLQPVSLQISTSQKLLNLPRDVIQISTNNEQTGNKEEAEEQDQKSDDTNNEEELGYTFDEKTDDAVEELGDYSEKDTSTEKSDDKDDEEDSAVPTSEDESDEDSYTFDDEESDEESHTTIYGSIFDDTTAIGVDVVRTTNKNGIENCSPYYVKYARVARGIYLAKSGKVKLSRSCVGILLKYVQDQGVREDITLQELIGALKNDKKLVALQEEARKDLKGLRLSKFYCTLLLVQVGVTVAEVVVNAQEVCYDTRRSVIAGTGQLYAKNYLHESVLPRNSSISTIKAAMYSAFHTAAEWDPHTGFEVRMFFFKHDAAQSSTRCALSLPPYRGVR